MNILRWLEARSPFPYYINHVVVALVIGSITFQPWLGGLFYAAHEVLQWRAGREWDSRGFIFPVLASALYELLTPWGVETLISAI